MLSLKDTLIDTMRQNGGCVVDVDAADDDGVPSVLWYLEEVEKAWKLYVANATTSLMGQ